MNCQKAYWIGKSKAYLNKMDDKHFYSSFGLLNENFTSIEKEELEKFSLPTAPFIEDTNTFSSECREGFAFLLWLYNKAL